MAKKQVPLRISQELYDALNRWAEDEFRSINGQIEYLLTQAVKEEGRLSKRENQIIDRTEENQ